MFFNSHDGREVIELMHDEKEKKAYMTPELVEYGAVIKLTGS